MKALIISACPGGMAASYLAANLLEQAAQDLGWQVRVECHSRFAPATPFTDDEIDSAELVLVAADVELDLSRFLGKSVYRSSLQAALNAPGQWLQQGREQAALLTPGVIASGVTLVAVTACPTGVAHTFMAAEALTAAATDMGIKIKVETQGAVGSQCLLSAADINGAERVIVAADIDVDLSRFQGKRLYQTSTRATLKSPQNVINRALLDAKLYQPSAVNEDTPDNKQQGGLYQHLMTGVSFMLPMVVAGGLLVALSFVFGINAFKQQDSFAAALMQIGGEAAFALMIPVLSGYIALSIAGRVGLAPGMIGGLLASSLGTGFLGGIIAGLLAGYCSGYIARQLWLPERLQALKPILIIPLFASLVTGLVMIYVVGEPLAWLMSHLTHILNNMGSVNAVLLGLLIGAMMCFDLGGPVNKVAYTFAVGLLASQTYGPMAAAMAAGMVPALGMGMATLLGRRKFSVSEREAGKASLVLGLCFISEGAIPFAARDPLRVIPCCMLGGAIAGALAMWFDAALLAPHGGIFVFFIPNAIQPITEYALAIVIGTLVTAVCYATIKRNEG
ncbi:PTS fructose transporter subunit IIBC [Oceanisphaera marina]|uniref:protein-N(pi)-phosphohistidine--D-fructose phosphotransferase n=1 Tax=Oceanisphaera marina TaxID=2017550 RepID=A0ABQ1IRP1_9GAMM|nr:PTS fructose-like transporter subunit IIB [Oceanisphaera marina]GGB47482.1 PTS fructose transporter subunit IIBC [Oceanisphaera marina]